MSSKGKVGGGVGNWVMGVWEEGECRKGVCETTWVDQTEGEGGVPGIGEINIDAVGL